MLKGKKIFISATYKDLKEERICAMESVLQSGNIPYGMELFPSSSNGVASIIEKQIDDCDLYILIIGNRYGSIHPGNNKSYTEWEYDLALSKRKTILPIIKMNVLKIMDPSNQDKFNNFKKEVEGKHSPSYFSSLSNLKDKLWISLDSLSGSELSVDLSQRIVIQVMNEMHPSFYYQFVDSVSVYDPDRDPSELVLLVDKDHTLWEYWEKYIIKGQFSKTNFGKVVKGLAEHGYSDESDSVDAIHSQSIYELWKTFYSMELIDKNYVPTKLGKELGEKNSMIMMEYKRKLAETN